MPELELREPPDERLELVRPFRRQHWPLRGIQLRIDQRGQKPDHEVQYIDPQTVGDNVKPLNVHDAHDVDDEQDEGPDPPVGGVRGGLIQIMLVQPPDVVPPLIYRRRRRGSIASDPLHRIRPKTWSETVG